MKVFISGRPSVGKTTLVKKLITSFSNKKIVGIITEQILEQGRRVGFVVLGISSNKKSILAHKKKKSGIRFGSYWLHLRNLDFIVSYELKNLANCELIVIDEIGKMEMQSHTFKFFLEKALSSGKPLVATVHRDYFNLYKKLGKAYWLTRENFEKVYEEISNLFASF